MKLRYVVFGIAICFVLYWSYLGIMNSDDFNNNSEQLETKIDSMNTIDEISVHGTEQDNESNLLTKRIIDNMVDDDNAIEPKSNETNINDTTIIDTTTKDENILDEPEEINNKMWRVTERKNNYNNELQSYNKDNVSISDNKIIITSKKEDKDEKQYTSGLVVSNYAYLNGYFEFTIKMSYGKGIFPAIWFMPADNTAYPEIDLFEMIGSEPKKFYGVIHYINSNNEKSRNYFVQNVELKDSYKLALQWNTDELIWYIDDNIVYRTANGIPNQYMYIIINQAVGGNWPGEPNEDTVFPSEFTIQDILIKPIKQQNRK